jgi:hypothetical protein
MSLPASNYELTIIIACSTKFHTPSYKDAEPAGRAVYGVGVQLLAC